MNFLNENKKVLEFKFENIRDFYTNAVLFNEKYGNKAKLNTIIVNPDEDFIGIKENELNKYKFSYPPGMLTLKKMEDEVLVLGGKKKITKWSYENGKEISIERQYEELPYLKDVRKVEGTKKGKFINLFINVAESCRITHKDMLWKSICASKIVDSLEKNGYRVKIIAIINIDDPGLYDKSQIDRIYLEITLKRHTDPLNLPLLITCLSPWFFRYWVLAFMGNNMNPNYGFGVPTKINIKSTKENIYIDNKECLSKEGYNKKIKELKNIGLKL